MSAEFWLMTIGMAAAGSLVVGIIGGVLLRKYHSARFRVAMGAAILMMLLYSMVFFPAIALIQASQDNDLNILAMLPGTAILLLLIFSNLLYRLPLIGGSLLAWALATARMQAARAQRQIQKLESMEAEQHSLAKA